MQQYRGLIQELIAKYDRVQKFSTDRTGVGTVKVVGRQIRFDLKDGFPLLTLKDTNFKGILAELLWFISGSTDNKDLVKLGANFWKPWEVREKDIVAALLKELTMPNVKDVVASILTDEVVYANFPGDMPEYEVRDILTLNKRSDWIVTETDINGTPVWETRAPNYDAFVLAELITKGLCNPGVLEWLGQLGPIYGKSWVAMDDVRVVGPAGVRQAVADGYEDCGFFDETASGATVMGRTINQLSNAMDLLANMPHSRRIFVTAWDPRVLPDESKSPQQNVLEERAALAFCHDSFQFITEELTLEERFAVACERYSREHWELLARDTSITDEYKANALNEINVPRYRLNLVMRQRSVDTALGLPFNIASYALLLMMAAQCHNMDLGELVCQLGDVHLYANQVEPMRAILELQDRALPTVKLNPGVKDIFAFGMEDFTLEGYDPHPAIRMAPAV